MKILIIRRDNIGDMICTLPLVVGLSNLDKSIAIDVLTNSYVAPILSNIRHLRQVFAYQKLKHSPTVKLKLIIQSVKTYFSIVAVRYDYIICFSARDLALSIALRGKQRVSYDKSAEGFFKYLRFTAVPWRAESHEVIRAWMLGSPIGLSMDSMPARAPLLSPFYPPMPDGQGPRIAVQLSARKLGQRWPVEKYYALLSQLSKSECRVSVLWAPGSQANRFHPGDDEKANYLASVLNSTKIEFRKTSTLSSLIFELQKCQVMLSPDGGAAHIAAALGLRSVILFGNSDPAHWAPWTEHNVILRGENDRVESISVEEVLKSLDSVSEGVTLLTHQNL